MRYRVDGRNQGFSPKISVSGVKVTLVPRRFGAAPISARGPSGMPREKLCR